MNPAQDKPVCLITGGSSGIGLATARRFAAQGYRIVICGRNSKRLNSARDTIDSVTDRSLEASSGGSTVATKPTIKTCLAIEADIGDPSQVDSLVAETMKQFARVDLLVNNAATAPLAPFASISAEDFETTVNVNIRGTFYLTQAVWKIMMRRQRKSSPCTIVNISSQSAVDPFPGFSLYGACKSWLDLMTQALGVEGHEHGIRVCSIRPGAVETPLLRRLFPDYPAHDCLSPETIADVVWGCVNEPDRYPSGRSFDVVQPDA